MLLAIHPASSLKPGLSQGLLVSLASENGEWESWWKSMEPERTALPGAWQQKCRPLQHLLLVRFLRSVLVSSFLHVESDMK